MSSSVGSIAYFNLNNVKFGFEYETLVQKSQKYNLDFAGMALEVRKIAKGMYKTAGIDKKCLPVDNGEYGESDSDDEYDGVEARLNRLLLASLYEKTAESKGINILFNYASGYHKDACTLLFDTGKNVLLPRHASDGNKKIWTVTEDASVSANNGNILYESLHTYFESKRIEDIERIINHVEIVSPILEFSDLNNLPLVIKTILPLDGKLEYLNNRKTSNHVHLSFGLNTQGDILNAKENVLKVVMAWWYFEHIFMFLVPNWRRYNGYCQRMHLLISRKFLKTEIHDKMKYVFDNLNIDNLNMIMRQYDAQNTPVNVVKMGMIDFFQGRKERYAALNLLNLVNPDMNTIEVRIKHGSNDAEENVMYMKLFALFFLAAMNRTYVSWYPPQTKDMLWALNMYLSEKSQVKDVWEHPEDVYTQLTYSFEQIFWRFMDPAVNKNDEMNYVFQEVKAYMTQVFYKMNKMKKKK